MSHHSLTVAGSPGKPGKSQDRTDHRTPCTSPMSRLPTNAAIETLWSLSFIPFLLSGSGRAFIQRRSVLPVILQPSSKTCNLSVHNLLAGRSPGTTWCVHRVTQQVHLQKNEAVFSLPPARVVNRPYVQKIALSRKINSDHSLARIHRHIGVALQPHRGLVYPNMISLMRS